VRACVRACVRARECVVVCIRYLHRVLCACSCDVYTFFAPHFVCKYPVYALRESCVELYMLHVLCVACVRASCAPVSQC
jgi:hypothetical protein